MRYDHEATEKPPVTTAKPFCQELPAMSYDAADWASVRAFIESRGIDPHVSRVNAWYPSRQAGDAHLRVVIPATSRARENRFWQARLVGLTANNGTEPKRYQSPPARRGDALVVTYGDTTHRDHEGTDRPRGTVLVEGPFDALAASELGFIGVALMGNTPPEEVLDHAVGWLRANPPAVLVVDGDAIIQGADLARRILYLGLKSLLVLSPYPYKDLAEMPRQARSKLLQGV